MDNSILWALVGLQVFMGAFDTILHHEGTERLAWRASQRTELRLHGIRNAFYALIFLCFAWVEPHGIFTMILAAILALEVLITLWDFVEEDLTRKLPATERINHTLLALNYGAILALATPYLYAWARMDTAILPTSYGWWSIFATASAIGVGVFSARDLLAAARSDRLIRADAGPLVSTLKGRQHVLITGGTGFIGTRLVEALVSKGHLVTVLTRNPANAAHLKNPLRVITDLADIPDDERIDAIVNLAGDPVASGLWSRAKRQRIRASRVNVTRDVTALIARLRHRPACLISGSAVGWYGPQDDEPVTETSSAAPGFTHQVCATWEQEAQAAEALGVRVVLMRLGLVLGVEGGLLARMLTPFEFGFGPVLGSGRQWMSWIELDDVIRMIAFGIATEDLDGPVNATAPNPVNNEAFTHALASSLGRPTFLRLPAALLQSLAGDMAWETMLTGKKVLPARMLEAGFVFQHTEIGPALRRITGAKSTQGAKLSVSAPVSDP